MKKVTVLAAAFALFGFTAIEANAQTTQQPTPATEQPVKEQQVTEQQAATPQTAATENKNEKVTEEQLPAPVKEVLKQDALADWQVSEINKIAPAAAGEKTQYEIFFTNAKQEKAKIRVDEAGAIMKDDKE